MAVHWQNQLLDYLGNLSWAIMDGVFVDFWQMIVLIGLIITLGFYLKTHQSAWIYTSMCLTIVIAVMGSVRYFSDKKHQIVFFSNYTSTAFSLVSEKQAVLITDKNYNSNEYFQNIVDKYHRLEGLKVEKVVLDTINQQLIFKGDTIVIAHRTSKNALLPKGNILLLRNNAFIPKDKSYEHIILDATNDNQHIRKVKKYRKDVFNVKNDKAYTHVIRRN